MLRNPARKYWTDKGVTDESSYRDRRSFIKQMSAVGGAAIAAGNPMWARAALTDEDREYHIPEHELSDTLYPAKKTSSLSVKSRCTE